MKKTSSERYEVMLFFFISIRLEDLYERAERKARELKMTHELLDEWKQRGDELLYSMIPQSIAESLRSGREPVETCKVGVLKVFSREKK